MDEEDGERFDVINICVMILFHGSNVAVEKPLILTDGYTKDFGFGFYCTSLEQQAKKWALSKKGAHVVSIFEYPDKFDGLVVKRFPQMTDEWLDFVADCRRGVSHKYDIVEGPMADDTVWNYVEDFVSGSISRAAFWELAKFKYPTHQMVFCTDRSLGLLKFIKSEEL